MFYLFFYFLFFSNLTDNTSESRASERESTIPKSDQALCSKRCKFKYDCDKNKLIKRNRYHKGNF